MRNTLLIVDDDKLQRVMASRLLHNRGFLAEEAESGEKAIKRLADTEHTPIDLVLLDMCMPEMDGKQTLIKIRELYPILPVIIVTASGDIEDAVELMRLGASDFITKPINPERLSVSIDNMLKLKTLSQEVSRLKRKEDGRGQFIDLIGHNAGLKNCVEIAKKAASSDIPVLITGESGVGKELLARAIHGEGYRGGRNFVAINCGAIPENLVESTLFGHEKGSFTGAIAKELGKFREAEGGTLFLDEVGELKPDMQTKLLRVLQQKEIQPVGSGKALKVNVRIISATNRNLLEEVNQGRFREDLYYRLNVLPIKMPKLSERREDIPELVKHILARFCATENKPKITVTDKGLKFLCDKEWNGNVRELENLLYRSVVITDKQQLSDTDFFEMSESTVRNNNAIHISLLNNLGVAKTMQEIENEVIAITLNRCADNVGEAAKQLGIGQSTLYKKLS